MIIKLNQPIPSFHAQATSSTSITEKSLSGQYSVFYFYPKDCTSGCTTESQDFTALFSEFRAINCQIFGISRDSIKSHEIFKAKYTMPFELISDPDEILCTLFDVMKLKNMYGKQVRGIERSTFLINRESVLIEEWRKVTVAGHAQAVLERLKAFT
ncbi:peroxiredoxin [Litorivicinus sp.]|nr:peroxiredoxin [Litorivicinus sp.]